MPFLQALHIHIYLVYSMSLPINPALPLLPSPVFFLLWQVKILFLLLLLLLILMLVQMLLFHLLWQRTFPINVTCIMLFHCTVISKSSKTLRATEAPEQITWSHVSTARAQSTNQLGFLPSWVISLTDLYLPNTIIPKDVYMQAPEWVM